MNFWFDNNKSAALIWGLMQKSTFGGFCLFSSIIKLLFCLWSNSRE